MTEKIIYYTWWIHQDMWISGPRSVGVMRAVVEVCSTLKILIVLEANVMTALLLVDASQGVQAQTVSNFYLAFAQDLSLVPVLNKVDLPSADTQRTLTQLRENLEVFPC